MIDTLIKLKQAGLLGETNQGGDPMTKAIELLGNLVPFIQSLGGGDRGETTFGVELVRALGPQLGKITGDIADTVKAVATGRSGATPISRPAIPQNPAPSVPIIEPTQPTEPTPSPPVIVSDEGSPMLPIFRPIQDAVDSRDHAFFPILEQTLQTYGGQAYAQLLSGTITIDAVIAYVKPFGGGFLDSHQGRAYLREFLEWAHTQRNGKPDSTSEVTPTGMSESAGPGTVPSPESILVAETMNEPDPFIVAKCESCEQLYDYDSQEDFAKESTCEECYTKLKIIGGTSTWSTPLPTEA
jgi:hypothetical protein